MTTTRRRLSAKGLLLVLGTAAVLAGASITFFWLRQPDFRLSVLRPDPDLSAFRLVDFNGQPRSLADYRSPILVIYFGYLHCPDACPTELLKLSQVMKRLGPASRQVRVLFITLDPARDSPQALKTYVTAFDPNFVGLTGTTAEIDKVAEGFNVEHAKVASGDDYVIDHTSETYVFDVRGHRRLRGMAFTSIDDFVHDIKALGY